MLLDRGRRTLLLAALTAALSAACQTPGGQQPTRRLDRTVITRDEMLSAHYSNVYDAVVATHSSWLTPRAPDSFLLPSVVWVYVDGTRLGGVETLRSFQPQMVNSVRFIDGAAATSRWGVDNSSGVIHISTWQDGASGVPLPDSTRRPPKPPRF